MIHNILLSIWHNKWRTLLIILLLTVSFFLCFIAVTNAFSFYTHISEIEKMFSGNDDVYMVKAYEIEDFDNSGVDLTELKDFVNQKDNCVAGAYDIFDYNFPELENNQEFIDLNKKAYVGTPDFEQPELVNALLLDPETLKIVDFALSYDDLLPVEKDGETYLPLYIGKDFEDVIKTGDILTDSYYTGVKYIVSGVLPETKWFNDNDAVIQPTISLDHMFVTAFSDVDKADPYAMQSTVGKIFLKCDENTANQFLEKALQKNMKLGVSTIRENIEDWKERYEDILQQNFSLTIIVAVCSMISIISALCVTIVLKKKEYGIRIAFGSSINQIIISYAFEVVILAVISGVIAFPLAYDNFSSQTLDPFREINLTTLCTSSLIYFAIITVILLFIVLLIPSIILSKYRPADLIKEEE